jgi:hypothetical protein
LKQEVDKLASVFADDDYVNAVLGGLPKELTSSNGIPNEAAIRDRFVTQGLILLIFLHV